MFHSILLDDIRFNILVDEAAYFIDNHLDYSVLEVQGEEIQQEDSSFFIEEYADSLKEAIKVLLDSPSVLDHDSIVIGWD